MILKDWDGSAATSSSSSAATSSSNSAVTSSSSLDKDVVWRLDMSQSAGIEVYPFEGGIVKLWFSKGWKWFKRMNHVDVIFVEVESKMYCVKPPKDRWKARLSFEGVETEDMDAGWFEKKVLEQPDTRAWTPDVDTFGRIVVKQRGAGCGKTFESVQMINTDPATTFIYLSKLRSAKFNINDEFEQQKRDNRIEHVPGSWESSEGDEKKLLHTFERQRPGEETPTVLTVVIATVDSFIFRMSNQKRAATTLNGPSFFPNLCRTIFDDENYIVPSVYFSGADLNKGPDKTVIVIDEGQNLELDYIRAVSKIAWLFDITVYIIGDKLQSIWHESNVFTENESFLNEECHVRVTVEEDRINHVRRFCDPAMARFVNQMIAFDKHALPEIGKVGGDDGVDVGTAGSGKSSNVELIFQDLDGKKQRDLIQEIIQKIDALVTNEHLLPRDFLFVFPILSGNMLAHRLETRINAFWINKFDCNAYKTRVLDRDAYWKGRVRGRMRAEFSFVHSSEGSQPIKLSESREMTRLMSIHSVQGLGCKIVFLLNVTQAALEKFAESGSIKFVSLLHVGLTRQKERLFIGVQCDGGSINELLKKTDLGDEIGSAVLAAGANTKLSTLSFRDAKRIKLHDVASFLKECTGDEYTNIANAYDCATLPPSSSANNFGGESPQSHQSQDWNDHGLRHSVMQFKVLWHFVGQQAAIDEFLWLRDSRIAKLSLAEYDNMLSAVDKKGKYPKYFSADGKYLEGMIPTLIYTANDVRSRHIETALPLMIMLNRIQKKLRLARENENVIQWCPFEMCTVVYYVQLKRRGKFSDFTISQLYRILRAIDGHVCGKDMGCACEELVKAHCDHDEVDDVDIQGVRRSLQSHHAAVGLLDASLNAISDELRRGCVAGGTMKKPDFYTLGKEDDKESDFRISGYEHYVVKSSDARKVFLLHLHPTCSEINQREIIAKAATSWSFATLHQMQKKRTDNRVSVYVLTLDPGRPYFPIIEHRDGRDWEAIFVTCITSVIQDLYDKSISSFIDAVGFVEEENPSADLVEEVRNLLKKSNVDVPRFLSDVLKDDDELGEERIRAKLKKRIASFCKTCISTEFMKHKQRLEMAASSSSSN
jgi:hypothetical protein